MQTNLPNNNYTDKRKRFKSIKLEDRSEGEYFYERDGYRRYRVYIKFNNQAMTIREFLLQLGFKNRTAPVAQAQQILSRTKSFRKSLNTIMGWLNKEKEKEEKKNKNRPTEIEMMMRRQYFDAAKRFFKKFNSSSMGENQYLNDIEAISQMLLHRSTTQIRLGKVSVNNSYLISDLLARRVIRETNVSARVQCQLQEAVVSRLDELDRKRATSNVLKGERLLKEVANKSVPDKELSITWPGFNEDYIYINGIRYVRDVNGEISERQRKERGT